MRAADPDGSTSIIISDLNPDGSLKHTLTTTTSADGLTRIVQTDIDGNGTVDLTNVDSTVVNNGVRTETITNTANDGSLRDRTVITASADGLTRTTESDLNGDGVFDRMTASAMVTDFDGSTTTTITDYNGSGTIEINQTWSNLTPDGNFLTTLKDINGDGIFDMTTSDHTFPYSSGARDRWVVEANADGSWKSSIITSMGSDGQSRNNSYDYNGDGHTDRSEQVYAYADGSSYSMTQDFNPDGSMKWMSHTTTSADGLSAWTVTDLNGDGWGDVVAETATVKNADGSSTTTRTDYNQDYSVRDQTITTTSASGLSTTVQTDSNGDGVFDVTSTDVTVVNSDGSRTETLADRNADASLREQTVITTSADRKTMTTTRDVNGDGSVDQQETVVTLSTGEVVDTLLDLNPNGSLRDKSLTTTSANGLSKTTQLDLNGDGVFDLTRVDATVINSNGSLVETITETSADGTLSDKTVVTTSANGFTTSTQVDADGDQIFDLASVKNTVLNADGSRTTTVTDTNADGSVRDRSVTTESADGLSTTTQADLYGDGQFDRVRSDTIVINANGSRVETVSEQNADGSLRNWVVTSTSSDQLTVTVTRDVNGDGWLDRTETITTALDGTVSDNVTNFNPDGSVQSSLTKTRSGDGLILFDYRDLNGDGVTDATTSQISVLNADGSVSTTTRLYAGTTLTSSEATTTSADGLSLTTTTDFNGDEMVDRTTTDITVLNNDGSRLETVTATYPIDLLCEQAVITTSADRRTITTTRDVNGDGAADQQETVVTLSTGDVVDTLLDFNPNGSLRDKSVTTTSANGLSKTTQLDLNGDSVFDLTRSDATVLSSNGSLVETISETSADGTLRDKTVVTTSAKGFTTSTQVDANGDQIFDLASVKNTVLNADGSRTTTVMETNADGSVRDRSMTTESADGLSTTTQADLDGDGQFDRVCSDTIVINANGSRVETVSEQNADGSPRNWTITETSSDQNTININWDTDGDGNLDRIESIFKALDGTVSDTVTNLSPDGSTPTRTTTTTSGDGLTTVVYQDLNGDAVADVTTSRVSVLNTDGSVSTTTVTYAGSTLTSSKTVTTSADGRSITTAADIDGNGVVDLTTTDVMVLNNDGSTVETVTDINANGSVRDMTVITTSADKKTIDTQYTFNLVGITEVCDERRTVQPDGSTLVSISYPYSVDVLSTEVNTSLTSANGLARSVRINNMNGDYVDFDSTTTLNSDGSQQTAFTNFVNNQYNVTTTTSADGLSKSTDIRGSANNGDPYLVLTTTDVTTLNENGSRTETITDALSQTTSNSSSASDRLVVSTSANGLATTTQLDVDGDGRFDRVDFVIYAADSSRTETLTVYDPLTGALRHKDVLTTSIDGRTESLQRDSDGDGIFDHFDTSAINSDGSLTNTLWNTTAAGALKDKRTATTSADGLSKTITFDSNGDNVPDYRQSSTTTLNADGSRTSTVADYYGNGTLRDKTTINASANGLSTTTQFDLNGDGIADETQTDVTTINADGTTTETKEIRYADGTLKEQTVSTTIFGQFGSNVETAVDSNGDGTVDRHIYVSVRADGTRGEILTYADPNSRTIDNTTLPGGTSTMMQSFGAFGSNLVMTYTQDIANANGSHEWHEWGPGYTKSATHTIDAAGVDTWVWNDQTLADHNANPIYHTTRIDIASEQKALDIARRLHDSALDRDMVTSEEELLAAYITNGALDTTTLANALLMSSEFAAKYGTLSNTQFIERVYQNALGRPASVAEVNSLLAALVAGTMTRADVLKSVSESAEHIAAGNIHAVTSNTGTGVPTLVLDHTVDKQIAGDIVRRLYAAALGRQAGANEAATQAQRILSGAATEAQVASDILNLAEFGAKYGALTNSGFVTQLFLNALHRSLSSSELSFWTTALDNNSLSRGDFLDMLAQSADHLSIPVLIGGTGNDLFYAGDLPETFDGGAGVDTVDFNALTVPGVSVSLVTGLATQANGVIDRLSNIENLTGGAGNDILTGDGNANLLAGGDGNDTLTGGGGYDTYRLSANMGHPVVNNLASDGINVARGEVDFDVEITNQQLWFERQGSDLQIDLIGTTNHATIDGWYAGNARAQVQSIGTADGLKIDTQIAQLVTAMATYSASNPGFNPTQAAQMPSDPTLQSVIAASWHA